MGGIFTFQMTDMEESHRNRNSMDISNFYLLPWFYKVILIELQILPF